MKKPYKYLLVCTSHKGADFGWRTVGIYKTENGAERAAKKMGRWECEIKEMPEFGEQNQK